MRLKVIIVFVFVIISLGITTNTAFSQEKPALDSTRLTNPRLNIIISTMETDQPGIFNTQHEEEVLPDCFRCHTRVLHGHDKLGAGTSACLTCHSPTHMGSFHLLDGTEISRDDSPKLCGQCHKARYDAWLANYHGAINGKKSGGFKPKCVDCHEPHAPQLSLALSKAFPPLESSGDGKLDCLSCHVRKLQSHDKLGTGSEACWACHLSTQMTTLHLAGGETQFPLSELPKLCAQCHQERYEAWQQGTHGVPAWREGETALLGVEEISCLNCHEPHQPQIALLDITKSHPLPAPSPPPPPIELLAILGISLLVTTGIGVVLMMRGEEA